MTAPAPPATATYLTFGGVDISQLQGSGKAWADQYTTDHDGTQPPFYTTYAKAAAQVALAALTKAATNDRLPVLQAVMGTSALDTVVGADDLRREWRRQGRRHLELPGRHQPGRPSLLTASSPRASSAFRLIRRRYRSGRAIGPPRRASGPSAHPFLVSVP